MAPAELGSTSLPVSGGRFATDDFEAELEAILVQHARQTAALCATACRARVNAALALAREPPPVPKEPPASGAQRQTSPAPARSREGEGPGPRQVSLLDAEGKQLNYEKILRNAFEIKDQLHAAIEMGQEISRKEPVRKTCDVRSIVGLVAKFWGDKLLEEDDAIAGQADMLRAKSLDGAKTTRRSEPRPTRCSSTGEVPGPVDLADLRGLDGRGDLGSLVVNRTGIHATLAPSTPLPAQRLAGTAERSKEQRSPWQEQADHAKAPSGRSSRGADRSSDDVKERNAELSRALLELTAGLSFRRSSMSTALLSK